MMILFGQKERTRSYPSCFLMLILSFIVMGSSSLAIFFLNISSVFAQDDNAIDAVDQLNTIDQSCGIVGTIALSKASNEDDDISDDSGIDSDLLQKVRIKIDRPQNTKLILHKNHVNATVIYTEQLEEKTYFTIVPEQESFSVNDDGLLLDFILEGEQDTTFIALTSQSYIEFFDDSKVYVGDRPMYLSFAQNTCRPGYRKNVNNGIAVMSVMPDRVVVSLPDSFDPQMVSLLIDDIPYTIDDVMVSLEGNNLSIAPIVPLVANSDVMVLLYDEGGALLHTSRQQVTTDDQPASAENDSENGSETTVENSTENNTENNIENNIENIMATDTQALQDIVQQATQARQTTIASSLSSLTLQECDILYQFEQEVLAIHQQKIASIREKLGCDIPTYTPQIISFASQEAVGQELDDSFATAHASAGQTRSTSRIQFASFAGWLLFLLLLGLHGLQKVRRRMRMNAVIHSSKQAAQIIKKEHQASAWREDL